MARNPFEKFFSHVLLLFYKHVIVMVRRWPWTLVRVLWPSVFLVLWYLLFYSSVRPTTVPPPVTYGRGIPRCSVGVNNTGCITLAFTGCENKTTRDLMRIVGQANTPVLTMSDTPCDSSMAYDIVGFPADFDLEEFIAEHNNVTQAAVEFANLNDTHDRCSDCSEDSPTYVVWHPRAIFDTFLLQSHFLYFIRPEVLLAVDRAIISAAARRKTGDPNVTAAISYTFREAPLYGGNFGGGSDWRLLLLPVLLFIVVFGDSFAISSGLNFDRTSEIRQGLRMMGLQTGAYWVSWFLAQSIWGLLFTLSVCITGLLTKLPIFASCNFLLLLLLFWLAYMAMSTFTLWLCAWVHQQIANVSLIVVAFICGMTMCVLSCNIPEWFFGLSKITDIIWSFAYPLHFGRLSGDIIARYSERLQNTSMPLYSWADLTRETHGRVFDGIIWPARGNVCFLLMDIFLGVLFAYYFDSVWPGQTGVPKGMLFFLKPSFWVRRKYEEPTVELEVHDPKKMGSVLESLDPDIAREHDATMRRVKDNDKNVALAVLKLSKTFKKGRGSSAMDCRALDGFTSCADQGSVFAIIGHNGAGLLPFSIHRWKTLTLRNIGKTTTINILTGLYPPSYGDARICGRSIVNSMDDIQEIIGVCPQKDIVWPELTAEQHLRLFCMLKGVPRKHRDAVIIDRAKKVKLEGVLNRKVETFSGGMKRRLSVAISMVGDPKVVFLDEPTSGLDPSSKKQMWTTISQLKENRLVVLTTHSMTEAEALADKICILALGRLRAVGSTLHLKQRYGAGYRISAITDPGQAEHVRLAVTELVPGSKIEADTAGHLIFGVGSIPPAVVTNLLHFMETQSGREGGLIRDWGLTQTSLEDIFLRVVHGTNVEDRAAVDPTAETQVNILLEDPHAPVLGFIRVTRMDNLAVARRMIEQLIGGAPKNYSFLCSGVPVSTAQETTIYAADLAPSLTLRPRAEELQAPSPAPAPVIDELQRRAHAAEAQRDEAIKKLEESRVEQEKMKRQIEELLQRVAAMEKQQEPK